MGRPQQLREGGSDMASFVFRKITGLRVWLMMQRWLEAYYNMPEGQKERRGVNEEQWGSKDVGRSKRGAGVRTYRI